jgi:hypothetical protein
MEITMQRKPSSIRTYPVLLLMLASIACGALLAWPAAASAQVPLAAFESAFNRMQQAGRGNASAIDDAVDQFTTLVNLQPGDPVLRAYLGAATAMRAATTMLPWKKIGFAEDGLAQIDKALSLLGSGHDAPAYRGVPAALEVRLVSATTFLRLPGFFNRGERGRKLLGEVLASPLFDSAPLGFRASVWLRAGALAEQDRQIEQARQWYERAAATDSSYATAARGRLKEL